MTDLEEMIRSARTARRDLIESAADSAVAAAKSAGAMSVMPAPHLPLSGLLLMVHPQVYDRFRQKCRALTAGTAEEG